MRPDRGDAAFLLDMLRACQAVCRYVSDRTRAFYEREEMLRDAVERRIEILGEAARHVSDAFKAVHPEIPWRKVMGTRHVLAHDYDEVNNEIVWRIATVYVPELLDQLQPLIPPLPADPEPEGPASVP